MSQYGDSMVIARTSIACRYGISVHLMHLRLPGTVFCRDGGLVHIEPTM